MRYSSSYISQKKNGKWQGFLKYKNENGEWRQKAKTLEATGKRAAEKELNAWRAEMEAEAETEAEQKAAEESGHYPTDTVAEYVARYIDGRATHIEKSSLQDYYGRLNRQIAPYIGDVLLDDLTPDDVDKWLADLSKDYAPVTVKKAFTLLKSAMTQAVERDRLKKNPTRTVASPKIPAPKPNALTEKDLKKVLAVLDASEDSPALLAAKASINTGLRRGELCALRWKNVDIDDCRLDVVEAIGRSDSGYYNKPPKTAGSNRSVYYSPEFAHSLSERKAAMEHECLAAGIPFTDDLFVFGKIDGRYMQPQYMYKKWQQLANALNLVGTQGNPVTFHDLRHSYATTAVASGIDAKVIATSMGHSDAATTLNIYTSVNEDAQRRAGQAMGAALAGMAERGKNGAKIVEVDMEAEG